MLSTFSGMSDSGSSLSITMGAGGPMWVARLRALAGMASLNNNCNVQDRSFVTQNFHTTFTINI